MVKASERQSWFAVRCPVGAEWKACAVMLEHGLAPWFWYRVEERVRGPAHRRRHEMVPVAYFPGYVFVPSARSNVRKVRNIIINGVPLGIVCVRNARGVGDQLEIAHKDLLTLADAIGLGPNGVIVDERRILEARDRIRVTHGPLMDFMATVAEDVPLDGKSPVTVLVEMFGRSVTARLDQSAVEIVDAA